MARAKSRPQAVFSQYGGGTINVFRGRRFQRGHGIGGLLKGLFRTAMPLLKKGAKSLGKVALETGVQVANDVVAGESFKNSVKKRGKQAGKKLIGRATNALNQRGEGRRKRRNMTRKRNTDKKRVSRKKTSVARTSQKALDIFDQ